MDARVTAAALGGLRRAVSALLVAPFLAPLLALGWTALQQPREGQFSERALGQVIRSRDGARVAVYSLDQARAWVHDEAGRLVGELQPPAGEGLLPGEASRMRLAPFVDGARVVFLASRGAEPITVALVGELPLGGGTRRPLVYRLPSEVPVKIDDVYPQAFAAAEPFVLACPGALMLLRLAEGWAALELAATATASPRHASLHRGEVPAGCRPMTYLGGRSLIPAPAAVLAELTLRGELYTLSAAFDPPGYLLLTNARRTVTRVIHPPCDVPQWGGALVGGRWVLFLAGACARGELWLTLADLEDPLGRPSQWSRAVPVDDWPGCHRRALPAAKICPDETLQIELPAGRGQAAWQLTTGEPAAVHPSCFEMRPLRHDVAAWEAGRTLEVEGVRYQVSGAPSTLRASQQGAELWRRALERPGYLLGLTAEELLVVVAPARLEIRARTSGELRRALEVPSFHDPLSKTASACSWLGHVGRRAYWLVARGRDWLHPVRELSLAVFDGEQVTLRQP